MKAPYSSLCSVVPFSGLHTSSRRDFWPQFEITTLLPCLQTLPSCLVCYSLPQNQWLPDKAATRAWVQIEQYEKHSGLTVSRSHIKFDRTLYITKNKNCLMQVGFYLKESLNCYTSLLDAFISKKYKGSCFSWVLFGTSYSNNY